MRTAIAFLTTSPKKETINFAEKIANETNFDVFIICDDGRYSSSNDDSAYPMYPPQVTIIHKKESVNLVYVNDNNCSALGYINATPKGSHIQKTPNSWDKVLCYFCEYDIKNPYDFVLIFEDDVFIPSVEAVVNLVTKSLKYDLVVPHNHLQEFQAIGWHWAEVVDKIQPPYYYSMTCAVGLSRKVLDTVRAYVKENKTLIFHEVMFNTLAMQNSLKIVTLMELKSIVWQGKWGIDEWLLLPNNVFHPVKDIENHDKHRELIASSKDSGYQPADSLPDFVRG